MPKMSRKLSLDETEEIEIAKPPKISRKSSRKTPEKLDPTEMEDIDATIKWGEELNEINTRAENIKAITKWLKEQCPRGTTEDRSEKIIEADKILISLKQEYKKLVWNYNKKYRKQERFKPKRLERINFDDEVRESKSWGELDESMHNWIHCLFYTLHLDLDIPVNAFN